MQLLSEKELNERNRRLAESREVIKQMARTAGRLKALASLRELHPEYEIDLRGPEFDMKVGEYVIAIYAYSRQKQCYQVFDVVTRREMIRQDKMQLSELILAKMIHLTEVTDEKLQRKE